MWMAIPSHWAEFVEMLSTDVGFNLEHQPAAMHVTGEDCPCKPRRIKQRDEGMQGVTPTLIEVDEIGSWATEAWGG